jgi:hypothetical protein
MEQLDKIYAAFEVAMDEKKLYKDYDFLSICLMIGADPARLDEMLFAELGYHGQDLVDFYASQDAIP